MTFTKDQSVKDNYFMVIGYDGSRAFNIEKTGTENYSYQLLKALARLPDGQAKIDKRNQYIVYLRPGTQGLALRGWPKNFQFKTINWPRLWTQVGLASQTFKEDLDILFIPAHTSPLVHKPGLKTVVTVHDLGAEYLPKMHQIKQGLYLKWITNFQLRSANRLIAVSWATKKDLVKKIGINPAKVEVVYEGFNEKLKQIKGDRLVNRLMYYNLKPKTYYLFVGTVQPRKNLERTIKAFSVHLRGVRLPKPLSHLGGELKLVIAGSKGWLSDEIYNLPKKLGIEGRVKFLGYVPDKDLPALYSGAIALVFPSLFEGFGLPILEAQACGCPVITSNVSSMPEVAGKGAILVDPYDVKAIAHAMIRVSESKSQRVNLIKAGFENVKRFSWEQCAAQTLKVFENL